MGRGSSGAEVEVSEYYMTMHVGFCASGPGLELVALKVGDKEAWRGRMSRNKVVMIDKPDLFGGKKKEGGLRGLMWWLNGNEKQVLPGPLAHRLGLTTATCPGFRGLASAFFTGLRNDVTDGTSFLWPDFAALNGNFFSTKGFLWCANNPYLKTISGVLCRAPQGLNPSIALIQLPNDSAGNAQFAANPGHIVFEAMTNQDFGMGESFGAFNIGSFEQCAQTLFDENFGLNIIWTRQSKIEDFIKEILDHIQGAVFVDPATGKHTMKLLRAVDPNITLPLISPDNAKLSGYKRKLWGDISNEIVVTWTNPETTKEETVTAHDLAAISMQGAQPASDSRNYYGIASQELAIRVAERDLAAVVHPIATCEVEVTKELWKTVIYDVVELTWPERDIESTIFRVSQVTSGTTANTVKLALYEDIFSLDRASYLTGNDTEWVNPSLPPEPLTFYQTGTAPAFMTAAALGLNDVGDLVYPEVISALTIGPDSTDDVNYELIGYVSTVTGDIVQESLGERTLRGTWLTTILLPAEPSTLVASMPDFLGNGPQVGQFILIGDMDDEGTEIAVVRTVDGSGYLIDRGLLDTTPKEWPVGSRMWAIPTDTQVPDTTRRAAFETASYHFRTRTSIGLLDIADAPQVDVVLSERPHLPNRPANVRINGDLFGPIDFGTDETIEISWARRNRLNESTQIMLWTDSDMMPEVDQVTRIYLMEPDRTPITTIDDLADTSYDLNRATLGSFSTVIVRVASVRDDLESLQAHEITVSVLHFPIEDLTEPGVLGNYRTVTGLPDGTQIVVGDGEWWRSTVSSEIVTAARYLALFDSAEYQIDHIAKTLLDVLGLTRASIATYIDADGLLQTAAADVRRIDHATGDPCLLIEAAATNLHTYSDDISNASWSTVSVTKASNTVTGPDGGLTGDTLTSGNVAGQGMYDVVTVTPGQTYTHSVWVKLGTMSPAAFKMATRNDTAGSFIATDIVPAVAPTSTGWTRVSVTTVVPAGCTSLRFYPFRNSAAVTGTVHFGNIQTELGQQSSDIVTGASPVTRAADVPTMQGLTATLDLSIEYGSGADAVLSAQSVTPSFWPILTETRVRSIVGRSP